MWPRLTLVWSALLVVGAAVTADAQPAEERRVSFAAIGGLSAASGTGGATVGATLPFDRMSRGIVALVASGTVGEEVIVQTGIDSEVAPAHERVRAVPTLSFDEMKAILREADIVVTHGGTGSLITALREGCRVVAMPRQFAKGEHYDDHQREIVDAGAPSFSVISR